MGEAIRAVLVSRLTEVALRLRSVGCSLQVDIVGPG